MHRIVSAITNVNRAMGGPELDSLHARFAFLVVAANIGRVLPPSDVRALADALPVGPALLVLRPFDEDRVGCSSVPAFHLHVVCRVLATLVKGDSSCRLSQDVAERLCRALRTDTQVSGFQRRVSPPVPASSPSAPGPTSPGPAPMPPSLRPTIRVPAPVRRSSRSVRAA